MNKEEKQLLSLIASDLLTGNHLLGRPRPEGYTALMSEFCSVAAAVNRGIPLTDREIELLNGMSEQFYGGKDDMCEQLGINKVWKHG